VNLFYQHGERVGAELDLDRRMCLEVVVPRRVGWRPPVRGGDDETAVGLRAVGERRDARGPGLGADVVEEDDRRAGQLSADASPVRPELGDDLLGELSGHGRESRP
jgi:hypothetical protein